MTTDAYQDAVHKLMDYMNDTVVFAKAQLPDVAQQMLIYGAEMSHMWMIGWIIAAAIAFLMFLGMAIIAGDEGGGPSCFFFIAWVGCSIAAGCSYSTVIEIRDAPKLYIMDELASKLKSTTK
jgi:hypothetical protein